MDEGIKFLGMDDKKEEQISNQSHHVKKPEVCNEEVKHQKENQGYFSNFRKFHVKNKDFVHLISLKNEMTIILKFMERMKL